MKKWGIKILFEKRYSWVLHIEPNVQYENVGPRLFNTENQANVWAKNCGIKNYIIEEYTCLN